MKTNHQLLSALLLWTSAFICLPPLHLWATSDSVLAKNAPIATQYTTSFKSIKGGFLFTKAIVNGQDAWFIVDTGMPGLILNTKYYQENQYAGEVAGASGMAQLKKVQLNHFYWNGIQLKNSEVMALELSHLERTLGVAIHGLIGMEQFRHHELFIDYENQTITLSKPGQSDYQKHWQPTLIIPFQWQNHLPLLKLKIGKRTFRVGIDTGAASNLMCKRKFKKLPIDAYHYLHRKRLHGINKGTQIVQRISVDQTMIGEHVFEHMPYFVSSLSYINRQPGMHVDGLLGIPFLSYYKRVSISFPEKKVYFWQ
ncbi:hypothetical protein BKI52_11510 [marine bacterium AO1-C]|nr:hypothetical protein BKI52_11510 [marine bacterium AO1-C]